MSNKIFKPNYKHSIIGITSTILDYVGVKNSYPINLTLKKELRKKYKNIIFVLLDGFGKSIANKMLDEGDILRDSIKDTVHSVFPPTTTAATTTYLTCQFPSEHGWLGWNMYFEDKGQVIDLFSNKESFLQTPIDEVGYVRKVLPVDTIFDKIDKAGKYESYSLYPKKIAQNSKKHFGYTSDKDMFAKMSKICSNNKYNFVYCYHESPDNIMHEFGPSSNECRNFLKSINAKFEDFVNEMHDTLIIVSADHGQIDIDNRIYLHKYPDICELLTCPPYLDARAVSFRVKDGKRVEFYKLFTKYFGNEFVLYTKQTIIKKKFFGPATEYLDKYLGDFVAIGVGNSIIQYTTKDTDDNLFVFKGHHSGLTKQEVEVPLILIGKK